MTPERFLALLAAHGAELRRWPEAERDAARAWLAGEPAAMAAARADAAMLDRDLDAHTIALADAALVERIVGAALPSAPRPRRASWWRTGALWPRAGWTLAGLAGAVAGAFVVSVALGDGGSAAAADWQHRGTAFSERAADWSEE